MYVSNIFDKVSLARAQKRATEFGSIAPCALSKMLEIADFALHEKVETFACMEIVMAEKSETIKHQATNEQTESYPCTSFACMLSQRPDELGHERL